MTPKIAVVYDWVTTPFGGAEQVLLGLHQAFPKAPLFTSIYRPNRTPWVGDWQVIPTFLGRLPGWLQNHRLLAVFMPFAFESLNLDEFDVIISVTSGPAKSVLTKPHQLHISYVLTPPRYLYSHQHEYLQTVPWWLRGVVKSVTRYLRCVDQVSSFRPDILIPISERVADRCREYYQRPLETVMYPPIPTLSPTDLKSHQRNQTPQLLCVSRLVAYKRLDLAIRACAHLNVPLVIVGTGPERAKLQTLIQQVAPHKGLIKLLGAADQAQLEKLYATASGVLMPGEEDFGITAVEAVWRGVPVLLHEQSGAAEIIPAVAKVTIASETEAAVIAGIKTLLHLEVDQDFVQQKLDKYGTTEFCRRWRAYVAAKRQ